ncbi:class A beta-lactamase-related serine hydrolase, partial [bacterium]
KSLHAVAAFACCLALLAGSCETLLGPELQAPAPAAHSSRLATLLDSLRYALDLPALAGAIVTNDSIVDAQAVGCRRYGGSANVTVNDQFHLGSCGKAIAATLLGILVDEGRVSWTSTLPEIFPEHANTMRAEYRSVTLRDVLSHAGGFMRDPDLTLHTNTPREQRAEVVAWALGQPPAVPRGTYLYSNLGYIIAGAIAEKLTGRDFEELLIDRVLEPLGLTTAGFGAMGTPGLEDQPLQHNCNHAPLEPTLDADNQPIYSPAGRLHLSIVDWARFAKWRLVAEAGDQTLLRPATARVLTSPITPIGGGSYYAMGWGVNPSTWANGKILAHSGSNLMNYSTIVLAPGRRAGFLVATNQGAKGSQDVLGPAMDRLINFYLNGR